MSKYTVKTYFALFNPSNLKVLYLKINFLVPQTLSNQKYDCLQKARQTNFARKYTKLVRPMRNRSIAVERSALKLNLNLYTVAFYVYIRLKL